MKCICIGAGDKPNKNIVKESGDLLVAVDGGWNYHLTASVKYACLGDEPATMTVQKAWKSDSESDRPVQIVVQLLRDGMVRDTVMLTAGNGWAYTWENLEPGAWQVIESPVPDGYQL